MPLRSRRSSCLPTRLRAAATRASNGCSAWAARATTTSRASISTTASGNGSASNSNGVPTGHNIIRTNRTGTTLFASFQRGRLEGKVHFASSAGDPILPGNLIFDKVLHLGNAQSAVSFEGQASGMTARNVVMTMPNVGSIQSTGWGSVFTFDNGHPDNAAERTEVYSCTLHSTQTKATHVKANGAAKGKPDLLQQHRGPQRHGDREQRLPHA